MTMVYRIYVEKKAELAHEAHTLHSELCQLVGIKGLEGVRVLNRYDVENIDESLFEKTVGTVFSEPQLDVVTKELDAQGGKVFAVEYLPGQYDQRADSAAQCIQIISCGDRPTIRTAKVYVLFGDITDSDVNEIKKYVINAVESREASLEKPETLAIDYAIPETVAVFLRISVGCIKKLMGSSIISSLISTSGHPLNSLSAEILNFLGSPLFIATTKE
jgi:phosphoribosylformylglycinamidine synthase